MATADTDDFDIDEFDAQNLPDSVDQAAVKRMRAVAWALDDAIPVPGTNYKIGIDPIVGILPVGGDAATGLVSLYIVAESARLGVPREKLVAMLVNIAIDVGAGSVPVLGDFFDATWKANTRNFKIAVEELDDAAPADSGGTEITIE
ncbi:DUF4112 domain-containing protein [Halobacterium sp. R2-5]|uniref:DUF4112 domain-containing protein n=1 Tax=Halobacterium sp. R2-5 TaxID=2715751 RepID=UPI00141ECE05|nr:DUF4112 domain-containing protein [Halobacterium sp. R2-5]NIB99974.1 DUF4112 domain-containing protein [Halobacterium sp. R2-5]